MKVMKRKFFTLLTILVLALTVSAQAPQAFKYQAVARNASGGLITNQSVGLQISILQGSAAGTVVYTETHAATSNGYGLVNIEIGNGTVTSGTFASIGWSTDLYFVKVEMDETGGTTYQLIGTFQLLSVPYALHSKTAESAIIDNVDDLDADPTNEYQDLSLSGNTLSLTNDGTTVDLSAFAGSGLSGTTNYLVKFGSSTTGINSLIRDDGTSVSIGITPSPDYMQYIYKQQLTADGDGQATVYGYRTRDSQNDGTDYSHTTTNSAIKGYNYWGDLYSFGVSGFSWNDYNRTGGVLGAYQDGTYWGSLGYKNSASASYGVYGSSAFASGTGKSMSNEAIGIGGGFFGDLVGSVSKGSVIGQMNSGDLFSQYNKGNLYTFGKNVELVQSAEEIIPVYPVSSTEATVYAKGKAKMLKGTASISFPEDYKALTGEIPIVTVSPMGDCKGVYISSVDQNGFTIRELGNGKSNVNISWISVAQRIDENKNDLATQIVRGSNFATNIEQVLYSDGNIQGSAKGMWWDGSSIQFGVIPAHLTTVNKEPETNNPNNKGGQQAIQKNSISK